MKTTHRLVLSALLLSTVACAEQAAGGDELASSEQGVAEASATEASEPRVTEMYIPYTARRELAVALGHTEEELDVGDVVVPGVLRIQHQYSIAALRLEPASWELVTGLPETDASWGTGQGLGVKFPRFPIAAQDVSASMRAAEKLFEAMVKATETTEELAPHVVRVTRKSARGSFSCEKTTSQDGRVEFDCLIASVSQVGSAGLVWGD